MASPPQLKDEDLERARRVAAEIVALMGEAYWPIFEAIDLECTARHQRREQLEKFRPQQASPRTTATASRGQKTRR